MSIISNIDKLKVINSEIKNKQTGTPEEFAKKLGISRSMLYNYLEEIKTLGAGIKYNRKLRTFYYENDFDVKMEVHFDNEKSEHSAKQKEIKINFPSNYIRRKEIIFTR